MKPFDITKLLWHDRFQILIKCALWIDRQRARKYANIEETNCISCSEKIINKVSNENCIFCEECTKDLEIYSKIIKEN